MCTVSYIIYLILLNVLVNILFFKVDFDRTKHLSENSIRKRVLERDKLMAKEREREDMLRKAEEEEEMRRREELYVIIHIMQFLLNYTLIIIYVRKTKSIKWNY